MVQGTLVHSATFFRAVLARASYHLTSTFLAPPGPSAVPAELKPEAPAADVDVFVFCTVEASSEHSRRGQIRGLNTAGGVQNKGLNTARGVRKRV